MEKRKDVLVLFLILLMMLLPVAGVSGEGKLNEFDLSLVEITDPYYINAFDKNVEYLLRLDPKRLLVGFQAVSDGIDPGSTNLYLKYGTVLYGGWEDGWSLLRGHTMGHYLTSMAKAYKQTVDKDPDLNQQILENLSYTVEQLKLFQAKDPGGYLFASPETHFDVIEGKATGSNWVPWYTMHKLVMGLVDVNKYTGNETALEVASKLGDWAYERASQWDTLLRRRVLNIEYGGINDALYELYKLTKDPNHLEVAHIFDEDSMFDSIVRGRNVLINQHANTQIPKFIGALNRYMTLGEEEKFYFDAAEKFWLMVVNHHTYVTGGNSENERFREPGQLDSTRNNINNESCNAYNMLELTRGLFLVTGDAKYADFYETVFINEIMASQNPNTGMTTYFKPMGTGYFKSYGTPFNSFWCCTGTGMENFVKLNDSIYFYNNDNLYINLYLASKLNWVDQGFALTQEADLLDSDKITFVINEAPNKDIAIKFREPSWLAKDTSISIKLNGNEYDSKALEGYITISRKWDEGDTIELTIPMEVGVSRLPDNPDAIGFTYGPFVLSAGLGQQKMIVSGHLASEKPTIPADVIIKDYIIVEDDTVDNWVENVKSNVVKTSGKMEFTLRNTDEDERLVFTPFYQEHKERYGIYFNFAALDSSQYQNMILQGKNRDKKEDATIDVIQITNDQHELVHNLKGNSSGGSYGGYNYRHVNGNRTGEGWFSYDMAVDPNYENFLSVKYYSGDAGRTFNLYIDDKLFVEETIRARTPTDFYDVLYKIPEEWISGKDKITVKFANRGSSWVGGIFDTLSILKNFKSDADLESLVIEDTDVSAEGNIYTFAVDGETEEVAIKFTPVNRNTLVYVNGILIDDTLPRLVTLEDELTIIDLKLVAEDEVTEKHYQINLER